MYTRCVPGHFSPGAEAERAITLIMSLRLVLAWCGREHRSRGRVDLTTYGILFLR